MFDQLARRIQLARINLMEACRDISSHESRAANIGHIPDGFTFSQPVCNVDDLALGIAVNKHIGLRIGQYRSAYLIRPVIVMGNTPEAGFDAADNHRHTLISLATALGIDRDRPIRTFAGHSTGCIGIV